tara:strand:- start:1638 stop:2819 length:1182 start_codon:yes stop_codon:yes gene_type:complete
MDNNNEEDLNETIKELANSPNILSVLENVIQDRGFAGTADIPKLVYLTLLTGMLEKPVSLVLKGPSGSGKSFSMNMGKQFIPPVAYEQFEGMSEKALVYLKDLNLKHKHLVIGEASGMAEGNGRTLLRQLLTEGSVRYATVQSTDKHGLEGSELPTLEGPTGLLMTTTAERLHPEDESRMLSVELKDSPELIEEALLAQALGTNRNLAPLNTDAWFGLYGQISEGPKDVEIPFAAEIARGLPTTHDRIKRDFPHVLSLIKAHALLHSATRGRNEDGAVIAAIGDYEAVKDLVNEPISQGLQVAVADTIRAVVEAVQSLRKHPNHYVSQAALSESLKRDQSVISRSVKQAVDLGYLVDSNPGQGRASQLSLGERKLPARLALPDLSAAEPVTAG